MASIELWIQCVMRTAELIAQPIGPFAFIIGSAEALPILCVSDFCERERERERERETPVTSLILR